MTAWKNMSEDDRDKVFLAAGVLAHPFSIAVNPRSKNDCIQIDSLIDRGLFTRKHVITQKGLRVLKQLNKPSA